MLASQITSVSQSSSITLHTSTASLRAVGLSRKAGRHIQQTRAFRYGFWSSYIDPSFQKEIQRRQRALKHKYAEVVNRQSSWDRQHSVRHPHWTFKSFMYSAWRGHDPRPGGRWVNMDELRNRSGPSETPQRNPSLDGFDRLFSRHNARVIEDFIQQSRGVFGRGWKNSDAASQFSTTASSNELFKTQPGNGYQQPADVPSETEYDIDPISNRRVYRKSSKSTQSTEIPVKTFKGYRSQFSRYEPPDSENLVEELKYYNPAIHSGLDVTEPAQPEIFQEELSTYDRTHEYKPIMYNEPDGKLPEKPDPVQEALSSYDERHPSYSRSFTFNEPNGELPEKPDPVKEALEDYDQSHGYNEPFKFNEPEGKLPENPDLVAESLKEYDGKHSYNEPFTFNEPDGKLQEKPDLVAESLKEYDSKHSYDEPFTFNEPEGKLPEKPDLVAESLKEYDSKHSYDEPFTFNEPEGKLPEKPDLVDESLKVYDMKHEYNEPFTFNEPTGQLPEHLDLGTEGLKDYDCNHEYQPFFYNHPDGHGAQKADEVFASDKRSETAQSAPSNSKWVLDTDMQDDIDLLRASDIRASSGIVRTSKKETESERQRRRKEMSREFDEFTTSQIQSEDEVAAADKVKQSRKLVQELELETSYLQNFNAHARSKVNTRIAELEAEETVEAASKSTEEKLTGNFVRDFPEEFNASWTTEKSSGQDTLVPKRKTGSDAWGYDKTPQGLELSYQNEKEDSKQESKHEYAAQISAHEWQSPGSKSTRLETSLDRKHKDLDTLQAEIDPYSKRPQGLETCYAEEKAADGSAETIFVSAYGCDTEKDTNTQKAKNQDRQRQKELVQEIRGIYEDKYGTIDCQHRQITNLPGSETNGLSAAKAEPEMKSQEPTLYKVLAYDPTMQEINIAETSSIVPDLSSPLTPTEVILRLSQPAKFFPYFMSLQSQGYEIASGSGDVLVFRKVREPSPTRHVPRTQINPIDGMEGMHAVGNSVTAEAEPSFKSNIDVRREEDVFSGGGTGWQNGTSQKKKPRKLAKKLVIGAAWVAGCSYALGVVAEFFRTGGIDGQGPVGF